MVFFWQLIVLGRLFRSGAAVYSPFLITFTAKFCSPQANQIISAYEDSAWRYRLRSGPLFYLLLLFGCSDRAGRFFLSSKSGAAVENIADDAIDFNAPVEIYSINGRRVKEAANGLFIFRQGNKAQKVLVK